jgi:DNA mismatch repair protein MutL
VRFRDHDEVREAVIGALRRALTFDGAALIASGAGAGGGIVEAGLSTATFSITDLPPARSFSYPRLPLSPAYPSASAGPRAFPPEAGAGAADAATESGKRPWDWCRILGQAGSLYVVLETADGLVLLDPHAAHERVLFERYMKAVAAGQVESQALLVPETVALSPASAQACRAHLELLQRLGFGISEFGGDTVVVDALPAVFGAASAARLLPDVVSELEASGAGRTRWSEESVAQASCKSAVKQRDRLSLEEIEKLVLDLASSDMPYTCPHGRPTMVWLSFAEMNRRFGRT